jgi:hypothetical protein
MFKYLLLLGFVFNVQNAIAQHYDCGWYGKKTVEERNKVFPFNKTKKILLVSHLLEYYVTKDGRGAFTEAEASDSIIRAVDFEIGGIQNHFLVKEEVELNEGWKNFLSHVLVNYTLKNNPGDSYVVSQTNCFEPRNSILFLDENDVIVCCLELCFTCSGSALFPDPAGLNKYAKVEECYLRIDELKQIFIKNGISYGIK